MTEVIWKDNQEISLENYILILPSISVGNVGQLATDLLLNNLPVKNVAYIHHPFFLPMVGADPFDSDEVRLTTSCQLYVSEDLSCAIIQHRSPIIPKKTSDYRNFLINFIKAQKISKTVLLCSSFSQFFTNADLEGVPMHYLCTSRADKDVLSQLSWKQFSLPSQVNQTETSSIPGGGVAKYILSDCERENISLVVLILVCSEGDNYPEAFQMVEKLNDWLQLNKKNVPDKWKTPISWTLPYGSAAPRTLY